MHPVANGHAGRSHLASSDFASAVWTNRPNICTESSVDAQSGLQHNANTRVISLFAAFFFVFFSWDRKESRNFTVAAADALQDCWLIKGASAALGLQRETLKSGSRGNCLWLTALKMRSQERLPTKSPFEMKNPVLLV